MSRRKKWILQFWEWSRIIYLRGNKNYTHIKSPSVLRVERKNQLENLNNNDAILFFLFFNSYGWTITTQFLTAVFVSLTFLNFRWPGNYNSNKWTNSPLQRCCCVANLKKKKYRRRQNIHFVKHTRSNNVSRYDFGLNFTFFFLIITPKTMNEETDLPFQCLNLSSRILFDKIGRENEILLRGKRNIRGTRKQWEESLF